MGLVTTRCPELEDKATVITRIHEAEKYVLLETFISLHSAVLRVVKWATSSLKNSSGLKISLVREIAEGVWGK